MPVVDPATGQPLCEVADAEPDDGLAGLGREGGLTGIDEFLETKYIGVGL